MTPTRTGLILVALLAACTRTDPTPPAPSAAPSAMPVASTAPAPALPSGTPNVLVESELTPRDLAVADGVVYFTTWGSDGKGHTVGSIGRVLAAGGDGAELLKNQRNPHSIQAAGGFIYWIAALPNDSGAVVRMPAKGGAPVKVAPTSAFPDGALAVDADAAYWLDADKLARAPHATGKPEVVTKVSPIATTIPTLAVYKRRAYWASASTLFTAGLDDGKVIDIAKGLDTPASIAADADGLFWTDRGPIGRDGQVVKLMSGSPKAELVAGINPPWGIATDAQFIYVAVNQGDAILRATKRGELWRQVIATGQKEPRDIAVDDVAIYWTAGKFVMRLAK